MNGNRRPQNGQHMHPKMSTVKDIAKTALLLVCVLSIPPRCTGKESSPAVAAKAAPIVAKKSIDTLVDDDVTVANHFGMSSDYSLLNGQVEQAITSSRKALRRDPDNIEAHKSYAEALDQKIQLLKNADPELMRDCISEWLIVFRSEVGEEKGLGFHGISVLGNLYKDDGYAILARQRLIAIAGRAPKPWETNTMYLKSVLRRASVNGKIISRP
ncbi:MAG: hypothetical protein JST89_03775 [Cyanobacteria bacterium SZAS-4]|nr:hypothetical protein [Cyanobacteria bacterium SZAS-4]